MPKCPRVFFWSKQKKPRSSIPASHSSTLGNVLPKQIGEAHLENSIEPAFVAPFRCHIAGFQYAGGPSNFMGRDLEAQQQELTCCPGAGQVCHDKRDPYRKSRRKASCCEPKEQAEGAKSHRRCSCLWHGSFGRKRYRWAYIIGFCVPGVIRHVGHA